MLNTYSPEEKLGFAQRLQARVEAKGWSAAELGRRANLTRKSCSDYLRGLFVPAGDALAMLTGTDNQFSITTRRYRTNPLVITGPGAGADVTAAGVVNDVLKLATTKQSIVWQVLSRTVFGARVVDTQGPARALRPDTTRAT